MTRTKNIIAVFGGLAVIFSILTSSETAIASKRSYPSNFLSNEPLILGTTWSKTYGGNVPTSAMPTSDGGYIVAGNSGSQILVFKLDASGNQLWSKSYGGTQYDSAQSIAPINGGADGYVVAGFSGSFSFGSGNYV